MAKKTRSGSKVLSTKKEVVPVDKITPSDYNPREITPEAMQALRHSVEDFGFVEDIIWNRRTGNIVSGHQRFALAKEQGYDAISVTVVDLSVDEEKALNVHMNNLRAQGYFTGKVDEIIDSIRSARPDLHDRLRLFDVKANDEDSIPEGDGGKKAENELRKKELEIRPFEHWDYLVFVFSNQSDWMNACSKLGIEHRETSPTPTQTKIGLGRVLKGDKLVKILQCVPPKTNLKVILEDD